DGVIEKASYGKYRAKGGVTQADDEPATSFAAPGRPPARPAIEPITAVEMDALRQRGFSPDDLLNMKPSRAREIIADPTRHKLSERYGKGGDAPPDTLCRVCNKPGARFFSEPSIPGVRPDRFPGMTALHLECCPKWFESGLPMED